MKPGNVGGMSGWETHQGSEGRVVPGLAEARARGAPDGDREYEGDEGGEEGEQSEDGEEAVLVHGELAPAKQREEGHDAEERQHHGWGITVCQNAAESERERGKDGHIG